MLYCNLQVFFVLKLQSLSLAIFYGPLISYAVIRPLVDVVICNLKQFDGLTWLTLTPSYFTTDRRHWPWGNCLTSPHSTTMVPAVTLCTHAVRVFHSDCLRIGRNYQWSGKWCADRRYGAPRGPARRRPVLPRRLCPPRPLCSWWWLLRSPETSAAKQNQTVSHWYCVYDIHTTNHNTTT